MPERLDEGYVFDNPSAPTLEAFIGLRQANAQRKYEAAVAKLAAGEYDLSQRWFMADETGMLAALTRYLVSRPIYMLRTVQELSDEASVALLAHASTLGELQRSTLLRQRLLI